MNHLEKRRLLAVNRPSEFAEIVQHFTPTTLAAISVELESANRTFAVDVFLDLVNQALENNVGDDEGEQLREWVRENM